VKYDKDFVNLLNKKKTMPIKNKNEFDTWLKGKTIEKVTLYNVNDNYFVFSPKLVVVDAAIHIVFSDNSHVSVVYNDEKELIDIALESPDSHLGDLDYYEIEHEGNTISKDLIGKTVSDTAIRWTWYNNVDENQEILPEKHYITEELIMYFEGGNSLQIATVDFDIENDNIKNPNYKQTGEIMVNTGDIIKIKESDF
jgi:hypothetical protein